MLQLSPQNQQVTALCPKCLIFFFVLGLTALSDSISAYMGPSPRQREKEVKMIDKRKDVLSTPTHTYCKHSRPLPLSKLVGCPGTGSLPSTTAPPDRPPTMFKSQKSIQKETRELLNCCLEGINGPG